MIYRIHLVGCTNAILQACLAITTMPVKWGIICMQRESTALTWIRRELVCDALDSSPVPPSIHFHGKQLLFDAKGKDHVHEISSGKWACGVKDWRYCSLPIRKITHEPRWSLHIPKIVFKTLQHSMHMYIGCDIPGTISNALN